jgi:hypothetical protein
VTVATTVLAAAAYSLYLNRPATTETEGTTPCSE